jgi:hypothetical protein
MTLDQVRAIAYRIVRIALADGVRFVVQRAER